ncbi:MAG: TatD family hydrolase [Candidatus Tectomicrobia bacterium]|nr:TatD family hydrolase [Candidatus Tectomicrobia bacterium]
MSLIDVHCHLDAAAYPDPEVVCQLSGDAGVSAVVAAGTGHASNTRILALQQRFPAQVWAALGFHPERLDASWPELEQVLQQIGAHRDRMVAMGEIGLPHYTRLDGRMSDDQAGQQEARLHTLVQVAARLALPVVLHAPHATAAVALDIVKRYEPPGAVFHWHKSSPETTAAICEAGYSISVTPEVCYRERDRQLVQSVPLRHLLLESDGPWAYDGEFAGQRTTPALVARVAQEVARLKGVSLDEVQDVMAANVRRVFGLAA